jgi:hypothetical protein
VDYADNDAFERAMRLLSDGVPLTLLIDLAGPVHSRDIYRDEPGNADWLVDAGVA